MLVEYKRWGYPEQRLLIGGLQFLGGLGLFIGLYFKPLIPLSSASLLLLMLAAIGVRIKIKDQPIICLLYTSPSPRDGLLSRMPSSA